jgi:hypothetical protein
MKKNVLHLLDPVLLLCHVPVELPQQPTLLQPGPAWKIKLSIENLKGTVTRD